MREIAEKSSTTREKASLCIARIAGHRMKVADTLKRRMTEKAYFSTIERVDGFQVQRVFLLDAVTRKGKKLKTWQMEVCRLWLNTYGKDSRPRQGQERWGIIWDSFQLDV